MRGAGEEDREICGFEGQRSPMDYSNSQQGWHECSRKRPATRGNPHVHSIHHIVNFNEFAP